MSEKGQAELPSISSSEKPFSKVGSSSSFALRLAVCIAATWLSIYNLVTLLKNNSTLEERASSTFEHLKSHCGDIPPISLEEFKSRQTKLANVLHTLGASAYIAEPGPNSQYFANISSSAWYLSERPLLLIITPNTSSKGNGGEVEPRITVLTPLFEASRAKLLPIASDSSVTFLEWPEDADPYTIAVSAIGGRSGISGTIFVDDSIRKFIADGFAKALPPHYSVMSAPPEIKQLRERKSSAEIDIMRCANEVTLLAIRSVQEQTHLGLRESEVRSLMENALFTAGLQQPFALTLFGENAALPHGSGTDRILTDEDFVLIDCGGSLHGYNSDITRTFAVKESRIPTKHLKIWFVVQAAQKAALAAATNGTVTSKVDRVARKVITSSGYGKYFTHRLGHGIGLEGHEAPYLRGGTEDLIQTGHTFSNEPGVYIEGDTGVRLEDIFYVADDGKAIYLTEGVGGPAKSPWII